MMINRQNPFDQNAPRVKVAAKTATPSVLPILLLVVGVIVLLISQGISGV